MVGSVFARGQDGSLGVEHPAYENGNGSVRCLAHGRGQRAGLGRGRHTARDSLARSAFGPITDGCLAGNNPRDQMETEGTMTACTTCTASHGFTSRALARHS